MDRLEWTIGGLGDPRPSNVEKARWRMAGGQRPKSPKYLRVYSHSVPVFFAYSFCYTHQTQWELNYYVQADCLLSGYVL
jgi:hypothetical protein